MQIITHPHPILSLVAHQVVSFDERLEKLIDDMCDAMYAHDGVGLAAPQLGVSDRVVVLDVSGKSGSLFLKKMINPTILSVSSETVLSPEGCLSVLGTSLSVMRHKSVVVRYQDVRGLWHREELRGLESFACQHEVDHLDGTIFLQRVVSEL